MRLPTQIPYSFRGKLGITRRPLQTNQFIWFRDDWRIAQNDAIHFAKGTGRDADPHTGDQSAKSIAGQAKFV